MAENIYEFTSLNKCLASVFRDRKLSYRRVSEETQIHPSYFSRVMAENASFSQAQLFRILKFLNSTEDEKNWLLLLWQFNNSEERSEKAYFQAKLRTIQEEKLKVAKRIKSQIVDEPARATDFSRYYDEVITGIVHMCLTIPQYRSQPKHLLDVLRLSEKKLKEQLKLLKDLGLIEMTGEQIKSVTDNIHLAEGSPIADQNHINWRLFAIQHLTKREKETGDYSLSVAFSGNEELKLKMKRAIQDAIVEIQKMVQESQDNRDVYFLQIDLGSCLEK